MERNCQDGRKYEVSGRRKIQAEVSKEKEKESTKVHQSAVWCTLEKAGRSRVLHWQSAMNTTHDPWPPRLREDGTDSYSSVWALLRCDTFSERYACLSIDCRGNTADVIPNWEPIIKCSKFGKMNPDWEYMGLMVLYLYLSRQPLLVLIVGTLWKPLEGFWGALLLHGPFHQSL